MKRRRTSTAPAQAKRPRLNRTVSAPIATAQSTSNTLTKAVEFKVADAAAAASNIDNTGLVPDLLNNLVRGTSYINNFLGNKIKPRGIQLRFSWRAGDPANVCRIICFQWLNSTVPTTADVLATATGPWSAINYDNIQFLNILYDSIFNINEYFAGARSQFGPEKTVYIKGKKLFPVDFASGSATVNKGGLYLCLISDSGAATHPSISYYTRVTFAD